MDSGAFDSVQGAQDLVDRRIGRNETAAIRTALAYVDAQKLYDKMMSAEGTGGMRKRSSAGRGAMTALFARDRGPSGSPLEPLVEQAVDEGYPGADMSGKPVPYQGYYFPHPDLAGDSAPGGALNYVVDAA